MHPTARLCQFCFRLNCLLELHLQLCNDSDLFVKSWCGRKEAWVLGRWRRKAKKHCREELQKKFTRSNLRKMLKVLLYFRALPYWLACGSPCPPRWGDERMGWSRETNSGSSRMIPVPTSGTGCQGVLDEDFVVVGVVEGCCVGVPCWCWWG